jgi:anthranilate synthase/aminodeoxychorismate synthase-like glutamine amidotransferase
MDKINVLLIDNFDSFTFNLADEFERQGCEIVVYRNNFTIELVREVVKSKPIGLIVISPGGYVPSEVPLCSQIIKEFYKTIPIFGVCLGHECIIEFFGGKILRAPLPVHGKSSLMQHDGKTIYVNIENPMFGGRYHSQAGFDIPDELEISAKTKEGIVMGVRHKEFFVEGVQFHPESILTPQGSLIIRNLLRKVAG